MRANLKLAQPRESPPLCRNRSLPIPIKQNLKMENLFTIAQVEIFHDESEAESCKSPTSRILWL
jgi:hypothetical protein